MMKLATAFFRVTIFFIFLMGQGGSQLVIAGSLAPHNTIQVNIVADEYDTTGTGTGCSLREAIESANTNTAFGGCTPGSGTDTITFLEGLHEIVLSIGGSYPSDNDHGDLNIESDLIIQGPRWQDLTINASGNGSRIFEISNADLDLNVTIQGVALINGNSMAQVGGAIANSESLLLDGVAIGYNHSDYFGGGICSYVQTSNSALTIRDSLIFSNTADRGGGIYNTAPLIIEDSMIYANDATDDTEGMGGGLFTSVTTTISRTVFHQNTSARHGGNLFLSTSNSDFLIEDSIIEGGRTEFGDGGNIFAQATSLLTLTIRRSEISDGYTGDNEDPDQKGGGIYNDMALTLENVTISGNFAQTGGGIYSAEESWPSTFTNITVADNYHSGDLGAGIYKAGAGDIDIYNSIVAMNNLPDACGGHYCDCYTTEQISSGYNLERGDSCGFGQVTDLDHTDPLIGPLSHNFGYSRTHALYFDSPAIDHGNNATCLTTDQRGWYRPIDGPDFDEPPVATCDIGAYEYGHQLFFLPLLHK